MVNEKAGAELLTKVSESLPTTGFRTAQQFGRLASYSMNKVPENPPTTGFRTPQQFGKPASYSMSKAAPSPAPTSFSVPQTAPPATQTPLSLR